MQQILNDNGEIVDSLKYKIEKAIERYKTFEPKEGYYLAFSGGKDSVIIKALADMAGVKYDAHYAITSIDPPELTKFIKTYHPDVIRHAPDISYYDLIIKKKMPPTRIVRYCCEELKEEGGNGRFVVTGVRWYESVKRRNNRKEVEYDAYGSQSKKAIEKREKFNLMNDNDEKRRMMENCTIKGKHILNPIIDWTDQEVWQFIKQYEIPYCKMYEEGYKRLGCIGCPMSGTNNMIKDFKHHPFVFKRLIKTFDELVMTRVEEGLDTEWLDGDEVMQWWLGLNFEEYNLIRKQILGGDRCKTSYKK